MSHFCYIYYFPVFIMGRMGRGGFLSNALPRAKRTPRPRAPRVNGWHMSPVQHLWKEGRKDAAGRQGLSQNAPWARSSGLSPSEREIKTRKEQSPAPGSRGWFYRRLSHGRPPLPSSRSSARLSLPSPGLPHAPIMGTLAPVSHLPSCLEDAPTCCPVDPGCSPCSPRSPRGLQLGPLPHRWSPLP